MTSQRLSHGPTTDTDEMEPITLVSQTVSSIIRNVVF